MILPLAYPADPQDSRRIECGETVDVTSINMLGRALVGQRLAIPDSCSDFLIVAVDVDGKPQMVGATPVPALAFHPRADVPPLDIPIGVESKVTVRITNAGLEAKKFVGMMYCEVARTSGK